MPLAQIEIHDDRFRYLVPGNTHLEKVYTGCRWAEGPVYVPAFGIVVWSDIPNDRMLMWSEYTGAGLFRYPSGFSNGNTLDAQGRLITCEHGTRRVSRTEPDGSVTVVADRFEGKRLNSPNDVVVASDDAVWFTDPPYGIISDYEGYAADSEIGGCNVYRVDPVTGAVEIAADDFVKPNGLAFSPDERTLYVSDTGGSHDPAGPHHIRAFNVDRNGTLSAGRVFAVISPGLPDGFRVDTDGSVWTSAGDGVQCYDTDGRLVGKILIPEPVSNLTFGGPRRNRLFITATTSLYSVYVGTTGACRPRKEDRT